MSIRSELEQTIANLNAQRAILGDATVDAAITALRMQLAALAPPAEPQRQRKQVTVLFADVSGFTAMSEMMDAEDVQETMNALWQEVDKAITTHGGHIDKHIGDAVMALWGVDEAQEDDPEQAIKAALDMQTAVSAFAADHSLPIQMRIGINTGPVLLGEVGTTAEFTAMGDTVNTASRLEHAAPAAGIMISYDTYRHVRGIFDVTPQEALTVKGKTEPLQVYLVQHLKPRTFRVGTRGVEGIETRTVGRDRELALLQQTYKTAVANRQTTVVTVAGEAGVGKSRLLFEMEKWIELRPEFIYHFQARTTPQTQGLPHFVLRDMLARRFQIWDSDPLSVVKEKFVTGVSQFLTEEAEMKAHILGVWLGYDFQDSPHLTFVLDDTEQIRNRATLYLAQYLTAVAEASPVIIFLEDIHWSDSSSLEAVVDFTRRRADLPLLFICLTRPAFYEEHPDWGEKFPHHSRFDLAPLTEGNTRALVADILRRLVPVPPLLSDLITTRAEGNPFYAEELVKMLIDDGVIETGDETWQIKSDRLLTVKVPATLTGVLQARLDKLQPVEKRALQQASIIGRTFWDRALAALAKESPTALPALEAREFIFARRDTTFASTNEYLFKHAILRDVTYETVLKQARREYHELVAEWLATAASVNNRNDEYAVIIADHYRQAKKLPEAGYWYGHAGKLATQAYAHEDAIRYLNLGLQFTPDSEQITRFALLQAREETHHLLGNRKAQQTDLEILAKWAVSLGPKEEAIVAVRQAHYAEATTQYDAAIKAVQQAIERATEAGDQRLVAAGHERWGRALLQQGNYPAAQAQYEQGRQLAEAIGNHRLVGYCVRGLGLVAYYLGEYAVAQTQYEQSLAIAREIGDLWGEAANLNNLGIVTNTMEQYAAAEAYYAQSLTIFREVGNRWGEAAILNNLGFVTDNMGQYPAAQKYHEQALSIRREIGDRWGEAASLNNVGAVAANLGQYAAARAYFEQSLAINRETGDRDNEGISLNHLGALLLAQAHWEEAEKWYDQALLVRQTLNQPQHLVENWAGLGRVKLAQNNPDAARLYCTQILEYLAENPRLAGAENPMRTFRLTWELLAGLTQETDAYHVLNLAAKVMQEFLAKNNDPALQATYLAQPNHSVLWTAWLSLQAQK